MFNYQTLILPHFKKQLKRLCKKYKYLKQDVIFVLKDFNKNEHQFLGGALYKLRIKSNDTPKGKNKTFRLVVLVLEIGGYVVPVLIYFKGARESVSLKEINNHLVVILEEVKRYK